MTLINIEAFLTNITFLLLLLSMIFYWLETSFFPFNYLVFFKKIGLLTCNFFLMSLLFFRWITSGHFPLSNLYESLIFLSWSFTFVQIILEQNYNSAILGTILSPITLLTYVFATFSLPNDLKEAGPLVPALQSNWLIMHVTIMILSYAFLMIGSLLAIAFLIINFYENKNYFNFSKNFNDVINIKNQSILLENVENLDLNKYLLSDSSINNSLSKNLDNLSYRALGVGFSFLTIGILSGAVWANEAWGSYWSWDPKETWALITWLIFAIYLHSRIIKGLKGSKPALIATFGFFVTWICYLGVNLIGKGLHSYGWIQMN